MRVEIGGTASLDRAIGRIGLLGRPLQAAIRAEHGARANGIVRRMQAVTPVRTETTRAAWQRSDRGNDVAVINPTIPAAVLITGATYPSRGGYHRAANPAVKAEWGRCVADAQASGPSVVAMSVAAVLR